MTGEPDMLEIGYCWVSSAPQVTHRGDERFELFALLALLLVLGFEFGESLFECLDTLVAVGLAHHLASLVHVRTYWGYALSPICASQ